MCVSVCTWVKHENAHSCLMYSIYEDIREREKEAKIVVLRKVDETIRVLKDK